MSRADMGKDSGIGSLSAGEIDCLKAVGEGLASKEIARVLGLSPHTVDARLKSACAKLDTKSRFVAAKIWAESAGAVDGAVAAAASTNLVYEKFDLPDSDRLADKGASAGDGVGPDDLEQRDRQVGGAGSASDDAAAWLEPSHPIATFFGGENGLSIWWRLVIILAIAIGASIAFGVLLNGYAGVSKLLSTP
ncbi:helix-turn-helix domain-containing protein [Sphingopyxis sp. A083]|uniref:helix-turn-helix domain-containing protein n=1 Tax=Sphingopyxis sp. A083 TaxID=1759083 RepID=UPI0009E6FDE1|nr:helix-turn-helix transcriptional regulator [Sphingopyxis sp. A083]